MQWIKTRYIKLMAILISPFLLTSCLSFVNANVTSKDGPGMNDVRKEQYNGPKARIAVIEFEDKTGGSHYWKGGFGSGMRDMMITALFNTDRFIVLERDKMAAVERERERYGRDTKKLEDADILITASVTEWEPGSAGAGGGSWLDVIGLGGSYEESHIAIDIRIIDVDTGRILAATSVEGTASSVNAGILSWIGGTPSVFGAYKNTPMESAIREVINTAVDYIVTKTPEKYYRYN